MTEIKGIPEGRVEMDNIIDKIGTQAGSPSQLTPKQSATIADTPLAYDPDPDAFAHIAHNKKRAFLNVYKRLGVKATSAKLAGINQATLYDWVKSDPVFAAGLGIAYSMAGDYLEHEAIKRAYAGNTTLLIFLLKGFKPDKYLERMVIQTVLSEYLKTQAINAGNSDLTKANPQQLRQLEALLTEIELQPDPSLPQATQQLADAGTSPPTSTTNTHSNPSTDAPPTPLS
jgi:hypothetical protein